MDFSLNDLWDRICEDDEGAFDILFKENYSNLCNFAYRILGNITDAEEIVQDTFIYIWQNRTKIIIKDSIKSYTYQIVHNLAVNRLEHYRTKKFSPNKLVTHEEWTFIHNTYKVNDSFIQSIEASETEVIIREAIQNLPEKCKEIFLLSRFENLSNEEISQKLKISQNTIRVQIFNALSYLKEILKKINLFLLIF